MDNNTEKSSLVDSNVSTANTGQFSMPTWGIIVLLVIAFFLLKSFIYIKDKKRHGK